MNILKEKIKEASISIVPIMSIMLFISISIGLSVTTIISILISTVLLILGIGLFTYGADLSMIEIGKNLSSQLLKTKKLFIISIVCFIVGLFITIAEPDLKVLAEQMSAINSYVLILSVGIGVGLFLTVAALRIIFQINLKIIIAIFYLLFLVLILLSTKEIIPVAFDSGGVTTGPMSVPFILAMGIGFTSARARKKSKNDSFGLVALCSIGPILTVLLLGLLMKSDMTYTYDISPEATSFTIMLSHYFREIIPILKEVIISLLPILLLFVVFNLITKKVKKKKAKKIYTGLSITVLGLTLFFIGVNVGYMPIAYLLGIKLTTLVKSLLIPIGMIIGFVIVKAEPAIAVLTEQIEKITQGSMKKSVMKNTIAIGVSLAVGTSIFRVLSGFPIEPILIVGYITSIILMKFTPEVFTMIAFDSGGAVSGPMTTSFLLPLIIGICYACGGNVLTDAFGLVALVAMSPLLTIQILGIIYNYKSKKQSEIPTFDETIIEFRKGGAHA